MRSARVVEEGVEDVSGGSTESNVKTVHHVAWKTRKVYVCPRAIVGHMGNRSACGRLCRNAQGDAEEEYKDKEILRVLEISETTMLDSKMCVE